MSRIVEVEAWGVPATAPMPDWKNVALPAIITLPCGSLVTDHIIVNVRDAAYFKSRLVEVEVWGY
jgi:hypothetical protein